MENAIKELGHKSETIARAAAEEVGVSWSAGICYIFNACRINPELAPKDRSKKSAPDEVILKWVMKYKAGYEARISKRTSNLPGTMPDPIINVIIKELLPHLSDQTLDKILYAHRLSMSAENILGLLLEEYLAINLLAHKWHCAWGETIKSVDFCSEDGRLLQVKNRSNSENSSSSKVRSGTNIFKWFRINAQTGTYMWNDLNRILKTNILSEDDFRRFVQSTLRNNKAALAIEPDNPWKDRQR
jgi:hypothetical protein